MKPGWHDPLALQLALQGPTLSRKSCVCGSRAPCVLMRFELVMGIVEISKYRPSNRIPICWSLQSNRLKRILSVAKSSPTNNPKPTNANVCQKEGSRSRRGSFSVAVLMSAEAIFFIYRESRRKSQEKRIEESELGLWI